MPKLCPARSEVLLQFQALVVRKYGSDNPHSQKLLNLEPKLRETVRRHPRQMPVTTQLLVGAVGRSRHSASCRITPANSEMASLVRPAVPGRYLRDAAESSRYALHLPLLRLTSLFVQNYFKLAQLAPTAPK